MWERAKEVNECSREYRRSLVKFSISPLYFPQNLLAYLSSLPDYLLCRWPPWASPLSLQLIDSYHLFAVLASPRYPSFYATLHSDTMYGLSRKVNLYIYLSLLYLLSLYFFPFSPSIYLHTWSYYKLHRTLHALLIWTSCFRLCLKHMIRRLYIFLKSH